MKKISALLMLFFLYLMMTGCGGSQDGNPSDGAGAESVELHVAAAASLTDAMKELAEAYQKEHPEIVLTFNFGSSGALQQAIENGGGADLFFSAAQKQMNALEKSRNLEEGTRRDLLENSIVLVVPAENGKKPESFGDLTRSELVHIALGEPRGVPVGQYTEEVLTQLHILDQVKEKAVYGSDVRQVLSWVASGDADCGVVYATDAAIDPKVKVVAKAPEGSHRPVIYPAAVIRGSRHPAEAKEFLDFASGDTAKMIFEKYGFLRK